ncbi:MAG: MMPL family transporter, partial [Verrucomicrobiota bacterium]
NAVPLLVVAGVSGWLGEPMHLGILIIFSVGLGLAVDDTIHLVVRFRQIEAEDRSRPFREIMDEAIASSGRAIFQTSVILVLVSLCFLGSDFTTMRWSGVTLSVVAIIALIADLVLLPALMERFRGGFRVQKHSGAS